MLQRLVLGQLKNYAKYDPLRVLSDKTGIQITRVFRILRGAPLKAKELEIIVEFLELKLALLPKNSTFEFDFLCKHWDFFSLSIKKMFIQNLEQLVSLSVIGAVKAISTSDSEPMKFLTFPEKIMLESLCRFKGNIKAVLRDTQVPEDVLKVILIELCRKKLIQFSEIVDLQEQKITLYPIDAQSWYDYVACEGQKIASNRFLLEQILEEVGTSNLVLDYYSISPEEEEELKLLIDNLRSFIVRTRSRQKVWSGTMFDKKVLVFANVKFGDVLEKTWKLLQSS